MPFVGKTEPEIQHSYYSLPVLVPPPTTNDIRPPFGKMEYEYNTYYPVLMPSSNEIQPPFIGGMEEPEIDDSSYQPPFDGKMEEPEIEDDTTNSVLVPSNDVQAPFIGKMEPETDEPSSYYEHIHATSVHKYQPAVEHEPRER